MDNNGEKLKSDQTPESFVKSDPPRQARKPLRLVIVAIICVFIALMLFYQEPLLICQELLVNGLLFCVFLSIFVIGFPLLTFIAYVTSFRRSGNFKKTVIFIIGSIASFLVVAVSILLDIWLRKSLSVLSVPPLFVLLWPIGIGVGIITSIFSFRRENLLGRFLIISLIILLATVVPLWLSVTLPYLYTPPALTSNSLPVYKQCIKFVKDHDKYDNIMLYASGWLSPKFRIGFFLPPFFDRKELRENFSEDEIDEMKELWRHISKGFTHTKCEEIRRDKDILLFYKNGNSILPVSPGVVYSLSGQNPNEVDSELLDASKPFIKIKGNWYMSRRLSLRGPRRNALYFIPKSLFDYSMQINGINPEDLETLD